METIIVERAVPYCSDTIQGLAIFGGIVLGALIYAVMFWIVREFALAIKGKRFSELSNHKKEMLNLFAGFWIVTLPLTIVGGALYWIAKWIALPFIAAEKRDLREMETRLNKKIIINTPISKKPKTKFKVGDLITGIRGNPDNYKNLDEGCVCKVITINEEGKMSVVLVDHKRFAEHSAQIGKVFKAPARNFVKYSKTKKARKR